jgi:hypothetical protein
MNIYILDLQFRYLTFACTLQRDYLNTNNQSVLWAIGFYTLYSLYHSVIHLLSPCDNDLAWSLTSVTGVSIHLHVVF